MRKVLQSAVKRAKKNNDSFMGVDALLKALLESKDVAGALSEAGRQIPAKLRFTLTSLRACMTSSLEEHICQACRMQNDSTA